MREIIDRGAAAGDWLADYSRQLEVVDGQASSLHFSIIDQDHVDHDHGKMLANNIM